MYSGVLFETCGADVGGNGSGTIVGSLLGMTWTCGCGCLDNVLCVEVVLPSLHMRCAVLANDVNCVV